MKRGHSRISGGGSWSRSSTKTPKEGARRRGPPTGSRYRLRSPVRKRGKRANSLPQGRQTPSRSSGGAFAFSGTDSRFGRALDLPLTRGADSYREPRVVRGAMGGGIWGAD